MRTCPLLMIVVAIGILPAESPARAQDTAAEEQDATQNDAAARALFSEGIQAGQEERWEQAADRFRRALALRDTSAIRFNLARSYGHLGRVVEAAEMLRRVKDAADSDPELRRAARELLRDVAPRIGSLTIRVSGDPDAAEVLLDGQPVRSEAFDVALPADPGHHTAALQVDDAEVDRQEVDIAEGGDATIELTVPTVIQQPVLDSNPPPPPPPVDDGGGVLEQWWFWTIVGVVVASGVGLGVFFAVSGGDSGPNGDFMPGRVFFR